jgi:Fur family peroxide stress response transcriptional regulator
MNFIVVAVFIPFKVSSWLFIAGMPAVAMGAGKKQFSFDTQPDVSLFLFAKKLQLGSDVKVEKAEIERRTAHFKAVAKEAGLKLTPQRLEIFRAAAASLDHPSAEAIFKNISVRMPSISLDTVYRTLWTLTDLGLISTLGQRYESVRFDANLTPHHHFICTSCGLTRDFTSDKLDKLPIPEEVKQLGKITASRVEVRGICSRCEKK